MRVDTGIAGRSGKVLVFTVRDVEVGLGVTVLLCETKVDDVDLVAAFSNAHEEVVRLDVAVDEGLGMNVLDPGDELIGKQQDGLERELAVAEVEQILQAWAQEIQDHGVVVTFGAVPAYKGDSNSSGQRLVDPSLIFQLRMLRLDALELDGDFFSGDDVGA